MISRDNWKLVKKYLDYRLNVLQQDTKTIRSGWVALKHLLQWLDATPLKNAPKVRPTLPDYLLHARNDGKPDQLSPAHMGKILTWARGIFEWLRVEHPSTYRSIMPTWIDSLQLRRSHSMNSRLARRQFWTLEDAQQIADYPASTLRQQRDRAALCFIFLSGIRGGAFVTLPIRSVDLVNMRVYQLPEWGVQTKNSKAAITHLLPIPRLLDVVREWDTFVRSRADSPQVAWYTSLSRDGMDILPADHVGNAPLTGRRSGFYQGLKEICAMAGVDWKSPHKIRHGHGVYGLKRARTMAEYKALSQNMMHESVATTDKTYAVLLNDEVGSIISTFTED